VVPYLPRLIDALDYGASDYTINAVWILGRMGPLARDAVPALRAALFSPQLDYRTAAAVALQRIEGAAGQGQGNALD
jgi:hypothetical protein